MRRGVIRMGGRSKKEKLRGGRMYVKLEKGEEEEEEEEEESEK